MNAKWISLVLVFLGCLTPCVLGEEWHVTQDTTIAGGLYETVHAYGSDQDSTVLSVSGGTITDLIGGNHAVVDMTAGYVDLMTVLTGGTLLMDGGEIHKLNARGGENFINGGRIDLIVALEDSVLEFRGGQFGGMDANDQSQIHLYGYGFSYPIVIDEGNAKLAGYWEDGSAFAFIFPGAEADEVYSHFVLHTVPEPSTLVILAIGIVLARRK